MLQKSLTTTNVFTADSFYFFQKTNADVKRGTVGGNGILTLFSDLQEFMVQKTSGYIPKENTVKLFVLFLSFLPAIIHLWYQFFRMPGSVQYPSIDIQDEMKVVQGIFYIGMPHIPHKVRQHDVHVFSFPQPAVHVGIDKVMTEIIRTYADTRTFFLRKNSIPEPQEVLLQPAGAVWMVRPVQEESRTAREQMTDLAVKKYGWTGVGRRSLPDGIRYALMLRAARYLPNSRRMAPAL